MNREPLLFKETGEPFSDPARAAYDADRCIVHEKTFLRGERLKANG